MIERKLHITWIGDMSKCPRKLIQTWRDKNPKFEFKLWDNDAVFGRKWVNSKRIQEAADWNGKADIIRYEILYRYGGILVDADSQCLQAIPETLLEGGTWCGLENETCRGDLLAAGYMGSPKGGLFVKKCIERIYGTPFDPKQMSWQQFGPGLVTQIHYENPGLLKVLPSHLFCPMHYTGNPSPTAAGNEQDIIASQMWASTFQSYGNPEWQ